MPKVDDLTRRAFVRRVAGATEITRTFHVYGLIASPWNTLFEGIEFPGIPAVGDAYPGRPEYRARSIEGREGGKPDSVFVVVTYSDKTGNSWNQATPTAGDDGLDVKMVSTGIGTRRTTRDRLDAPMVLTPPPSFTAADPYLTEAQDSFPVATIVFERIETEPNLVRAINLTGKVNSVALPTPGSGLWPERSIKLNNVDSRTTDGGQTWRVTYEFGYNAALWNYRDYWRGSDGKIPQDGVEQVFEVDNGTDFNGLGLEWDDLQVPLP